MRHDGFTLIELIIVMGIMSILAAIALPRYSETRDRAYVATMQSDLVALRLAQENFRTATGTGYAANVGLLATRFQPSAGITATIVSATADGWSGETSHVASSRVCSFSSDDGVIVCAPAVDPEEDKGGGK